MSNSLVRRATGFMQLGRPKPVWFETVVNKFPPLTFKAPQGAGAARTRPKNSPPPIWHPPKLVYPEDRFYQKTLKKNPIELLKPSSLNEMATDPTDSRTILKYQMEIMETGKDAQTAYGLAEKRFWDERKQQEIRDKIARQQFLYAKDQLEASPSFSRNQLKRRLHEPVHETIRSILEEEKTVLASLKEQ